ncbi:hypothetical protein L861_04815 [Litchfieldella anticariensis FP35 = DSM 16096]|uniref:Uncharacterized protein n=1 Tax=Litchfieldella anticariensis (strain DSM 16096 / CECT 5854 / CIP 108499 / LMG 22089 / FP35) TaxID=1121939 RepID=S2KMV4_LITA3|nr:hypothetical protein L861_04815 [Halomonas anticariensis FP35 = DSM 16096]
MEMTPYVTALPDGEACLAVQPVLGGKLGIAAGEGHRQLEWLR